MIAGGFSADWRRFGYFLPMDGVGCVAVCLNQRIDHYTSSLNGEPLALKKRHGFGAGGFAGLSKARPAPDPTSLSLLRVAGLVGQ